MPTSGLDQKDLIYPKNKMNIIKLKINKSFKRILILAKYWIFHQ